MKLQTKLSWLLFMTHSVNVGNTSVWVLAEMEIMEQMATVMKRV